MPEDIERDRAEKLAILFVIILLSAIVGEYMGGSLCGTVAGLLTGYICGRKLKKLSVFLVMVLSVFLGGNIAWLKTGLPKMGVLAGIVSLVGFYFSYLLGSFAYDHAEHQNIKETGFVLLEDNPELRKSERKRWASLHHKSRTERSGWFG